MKKILVSFFILVNFLSCKQEPTPTPDQFNYYYLTAEQLAKTPYFTNPAFDTLTFVSNQNDTVVFAKTRVDSGWYRIIDASPGNNYTVYHYYQQLTANYQTIKGDGSFEVVHSKKINNGNSDMLNISFKTYTFIFGDLVIGNLLHPNYRAVIQIRGNNFEHITSIKSEDKMQNVDGFLNRKFGVFYIDDKIKNIGYLILQQ